MIRLKRLKPEQARSIRHWGIELAVVVVGVLLALAASEWASDRAERARHADVLEALDREVRYSQALAGRGVMVSRCNVQQYERIMELLLESGDDWPGMTAAGGSADRRTDFGPISYITQDFAVDAFVRARTTGAMEQLPPDIELAYEELFYTVRALERLHKDMNYTLDQLVPLVHPQRLDAAARLEMLQHLARFDRVRRTLMVQSERLARDATTIGANIGEDSAEGENFREMAGRIRESLLDDSDCLVEVDWSTGKPREDSE